MVDAKARLTLYFPYVYHYSCIIMLLQLWQQEHWSEYMSTLVIICSEQQQQANKHCQQPVTQLNFDHWPGHVGGLLNGRCHRPLNALVSSVHVLSCFIICPRAFTVVRACNKTAKHSQMVHLNYTIATYSNCISIQWNNAHAHRRL